MNKSKHSTSEKEKYVIVKALYEWKYYLTRHHFTLTNQQSVAFMFDTRTSKIQKNQIQKWKTEPPGYSFEKMLPWER